MIRRPVDSKSQSAQKGQLELGLERPVFADRNASMGGRSFYFFDFDDNVAYLSTPIVVFHRQSGQELRVSSGEWSKIHRTIGKPGPYSEFEIRLCDRTGSFRHFRDRNIPLYRKWLGAKQDFVRDLVAALEKPDVEWKGPAWDCFYHATLNQRPTSLITARGHDPETIREGIEILVERGYLPRSPNFLTILPVTHPATQLRLRDRLPAMVEDPSVAQLKRAAIRASVEKAVDVYGDNPHHRFGMSDDDPHNIELITAEMKDLKRERPEMGFFVIETHGGHSTKWEILADRAEATACAINSQVEVLEQLDLFKTSRN